MKSRAAIAALVALTLVMGVVSAVYARRAVSSGIIRACVTSGGAFKQVGTCGAGGHHISWNQRGPRGLRGPAGLHGYVVANASFFIPANSAVSRTLKCPNASNKKRPISGGFGMGPEYQDLKILESTPTGSGWQVAVSNSADAQRQIFIFVVCANVS